MQLKSVVDPLTIFSHYLSLKKSGSRYRALCPFHNEKTPSFYASDNGMFHCFGCGTGGDVVKFVMLIEKMDFKECIQVLSQRYGIPLKHTSPTERKEKDDLLDLMKQATDFYHNLLTTSASGEEPLKYLEQRGVTKETVRQFQLGWAPNSWNSLLEHFHKRDVPPSLLEKCGLVVPRHGEGYYDRYRSRIMVPIHDIHGNLVALGGRIFQGTGEEAKYLNSPESQIYTKSNHLFGLYVSKEHIQQKKFAILVEGYFDMIMPFQAGHQNIVASLGTSLTEAQAKLLRRYTDRIVVFYDPDTAGKTATLRALPILLKETFLVFVGTLPTGLDPDTYIRERGAAEFQAEIDRALRYDQLFLQHLAENHNLKIPPGRLAASDELMELLPLIANPFEREQIMNHFASTVGVSIQLLQEQFRRKQKFANIPNKARTDQRVMPQIEREFLQILLADANVARQILASFEAQDFEELARADLFEQLHQIVSTEDELSTAELIHAFPSEEQSLLTAIVMHGKEAAPTLEYARDFLAKLRKNRENRMLEKLTAEIEEAAKGSDSEKLTELLKKKVELGKPLRP